MKAWIGIAMMVTLTVCGTIAPSAQDRAVGQRRLVLRRSTTT